MADEKIGLQIDVNTNEVKKSVGQLRQEIKNAAKDVKVLGDTFGNLSPQATEAATKLEKLKNEIKGAAGEGGNMRTKLREANQELFAMSEKFGSTSKEAANAAKKVAGLKDAIGDAKLLSDGFNPDEKFKSFSSALSGVVGGFAGLQGAMSLFGVESQEVEKTLLKVQAAMALSQGLNSVLAAKDAFLALGTVIKTHVVAAFATLRGAMLATGIGALVVGIGLLINKFIALKEAANEAAEAQKRALDEESRLADIKLNELNKHFAQQQKLDVARAKSTGKNEKEIFDIEQGYRNDKLKALKEYYEEVKLDKTKSVDAINQIADLEIEIETERLNRIADARKKHGEKKPGGPKAGPDPRIEEARRLNEQLLEENNKYRLTEEEQSLEHYRKLRAILLAGKQGTLQADIAQNRAQADIRKADLQTTLDEEGKQKIDNVLQLANTLIPMHKGIQVNQTQLEADQAQARKLIAEQERNHKRDVLNSIGGLVEAAAVLLGQQTVAGKTFAIASTLISTYDAAQKAYASQFVALNPTSPILANIAAATAIVQGLARVKAIASVKVPGKGAAGFAGGSLSTGSTGPATLNPSLKSNTTILDKKSIDDLANQAVKVFVVESDISNSQGRVQRIKRSSIFG